ncbi:MAG: YbhB/YbcL family Raf kinase inhibitor-like protein [Chlamydiales bacterium]
MQLTSPAFQQARSIPRIYTCQGRDISPPLEISGVPEKAESLALIMDDPDVPKSVRSDGMWVHWVVCNIDPHLTHIEEEAEPFGLLGRNTGGENRYMGPCPPDREHRYFFKLYALDTKLEIKKGFTKEELLAKMKGRILAEAELMGLYVKS